MESKYSLGAGKVFPKFQMNKSTNHINFNNNLPKKPRLDQSPARVVQSGTETLLQQRKSLPVYSVRNRLLTEIQKHSTVILIGETGSGKTTQIPQFMHEIRLEKDGKIGVTQPRRVAAITLSQRVAQEMSTELGAIVGYTVRFEDVTSECTKLKYLTDGMLLREAMLDNLLMSYNIIVLDEAHERTVHTDVLFGIVKQAQTLRKERQMKPLKIVVMSATMDVDHFCDYFGGVPVIYLEGRQYPVQVLHAKQTQDDYVFSSLVTIFQIHRETPANQDILVFLTGQEEIEAMAHSIRSIAKELDSKYPSLKVYPMYSSLPSHQQLDVFRPTPQGMRKVILSTNIAETSVTITGIKHVVDSGMVKVRTHHPGTGMDLLKVQRISQAQAWQRTGRAGRESAGFCYRVYTRQEFDSMLKNSIPEIQRCNLTSVVLQLLALGIDALSFDFMDMPPKESVNAALQQLKQLGAIESVECTKLTKLGNQMALFPLDPRFSKILLSAQDYCCLEEILSLVALLSSESVFVTPPTKREQAVAAHQKFVSTAGDHITLLSIFRQFNTVAQKKQWCHENFLNARNLQYASDVRTQLAELCQSCKIPPSSCGQNLDQVRKCLITGLFMNVAELQREKQYLTVESRQAVAIHPSSVLFGSQPHCVLFTEVVQTGRCFLRQVSQIDPEWLREIVPEYMRQHRLLSCVT
ncbi:ATP-dependent RNA helicase DHX33-like [Periplaneta americana]|uniref:ATP-dependent RNA helicase DHX33-like n=1 Tax=Periplaneta americana TaxID=6978 RepID=UPI0037E87BF3